MKHIKLFEEFTLTNESLKFKDLVDTNFKIEIGSGTENGTWNQKELTEKIKEGIKHNLFDWDFYYNWTDNNKEYSKVFDKDTLNPLLKKLDKTLKDLFTFKDNKLTFNITGDDAEAWIDNWFQTNKSISKSLKQDYYDYREEYAGVKLK
jgi:hypothetical protein